MALAGQTNVNNARTTFETLVDGALQADRGETAAWQPFARRYESGGARKIEITTVGATPDYEEWEGDKNLRGFRKLNTSMSFKKWHKSMALSRESVVNDLNGSTAVGLAAHARNVSYIFDKLVFEALVANPTVADGTAMIANTHTHGTYDNLTTTALNFNAFDAGRVAMRNQTDEFGEFLDVMPDYLLVNPDEERIGLEITQADARPISVGTGGTIAVAGGGIGATQVANVYRGAVSLVVSPRITAGTWFLLDSRYPPIALGVWRDPESVVLDSMEGEERFKRDQFLYSVEADVNTAGLTHHGIYAKIA